MKKQLNILIPCAGRGSRFIEAGYYMPKPLITVLGKPMIQWVLDSLQFRNVECKFIFLVLKEHDQKFHIVEEICKLIPNSSTFIQIDTITQGAACTSLFAKDLINNDNPLIICNSDQYFEFDKEKFKIQAGLSNKLLSSHKDGIILTFKSDNPKWSYAKTKPNGIIEQVAEKVVISNHATVGCYYYAHGKDYVKYTEQMIAKNIRTNGEFYICPVYNEFIQDQKLVTIFPVTKMVGLGTPEDVKNFTQG
jgi:dTDP-glucose pyrophosphorylase